MISDFAYYNISIKTYKSVKNDVLAELLWLTIHLIYNRIWLNLTDYVIWEVKEGFSSIYLKKNTLIIGKIAHCLISHLTMADPQGPNLG